VSIERRKYSRTSITLPVEVRAYACEKGQFVEYTETVNLSPLGASFRMRNRAIVDDILLITLAMPQQLRLFDFDMPQYQIYAQVRRVRPRPDGFLSVGVAFISKEPPEIELANAMAEETLTPEASAAQPPASDPQQFATRPISPKDIPAVLKSEGQTPMVTKSESPAGLKLPTIAQSNALSNDRNEPRAKLRLSLSIRGLDKNGQYFVEVIQTEDVSKHGLCFVLTKRELEINSIIEIVGFQGKFNAQGEIRHIHLNHTERKFRIGIRLLGDPANWIVK
jgi:hypothetical protein